MKRFVISVVVCASAALAILLSAPAAQAKAQMRAGCVYAVQPGDSLSTIATRFNASWQTLYAMNQTTVGGDPNLIYPGQQIALCGTAVAITQSQTVHTVVKPHAAPSAPVVQPHGAPASQGSVQSMIISTFGSYAGSAMRVAQCESGFSSTAHNSIAVYYGGRYLGHAMGVFQIVDATWASTSYARYSPYDAWANIHAAYEIFHRDGNTWREWQCQP